MATIYELTGQFLELLEMAQDGEFDPEAIEDTLEAIEGEFEDKADGYAKIIRELKNDAAALKAEEERLEARRKALENNAEYLKNRLEAACILTGKEKFKTLLFSFNVQNNPPSVVIEDGATIPEKYLVYKEPSIDKKAMLADLKAGENLEQLDGVAHLVQTRGLRIR